ncbi:MAG TPA: DUF3397 domain-containing protein [Tetragenococcus sp.]|nr:DUF3397 domain-containing protein [Tetragenococcus sp.]
MHSFSWTYVFWYFYPILILFLITILMKIIPLKEKFHLKIPDLAVPFLLLGIHRLSKISFRISVFPYFLITLLLLGIVVAIYQAYVFEEILYGRFFKMYWRLVFLLTMVLYLLLVLLSILQFI